MSETDDDRALLPFEHEGARLIRRQWHNGQWYFSVIDVIRVLTDTDAPSTYWGMMKKRLANVEGFAEVFTKCEKLKMRAVDGKMHPTDAANAQSMLRIAESIPLPKAEPIKQ